MIFNRGYKTLGVEKGDEREVERVDYERNTVWLQDGNGNLVDWRPYMLAGAKGGVEVYRSEEMELRRGDRVRWTRNDPGSELADGDTAAVESVGRDGVLFRLEDGSATKLAEGDPQLRHLDRAWASTVHAFQGRTVDGLVAAMPTGNPDLTNQRAFYVAISRARDHAELVTDDAQKLSEQLERATGERVAALDGVTKEAAFGLEPSQDRNAGHADRMDRGHETELQTDREHEPEHRPWHELDWDSDPELAERGAGGDRSDLESGEKDREVEHEDDRSGGPERDSVQEETLDAEEMSRDMDLEL